MLSQVFMEFDMEQVVEEEWRELVDNIEEELFVVVTVSLEPFEAVESEVDEFVFHSSTGSKW